jgi:hypothetical protein
MSSPDTVTEEDVIRAAWLEWLVTRQISTCNGALFIPLIVEVPQEFRDDDLGLSGGRSIFWTLRNIEKINRRSDRVRVGKPVVKLDKEISAAERRRRWRAKFYAQQFELPAAA